MNLYLVIGILSPIALLGQPPAVDMQRIKEICNSEVTEIRFSQTGGGCFSGYAKNTTFYRRLLCFTTDTSSGIISSFQAATQRPRTISALAVRLFIDDLPALLEQPAPVWQMVFTQQDYAQCRSKIDTMRLSLSGALQLKLRYGFIRRNDTDYQRLYACLDSLSQISPAALGPSLARDTVFFKPYRCYVWFINSNGSYINISYAGTSRYSAISHWKIDINGQVIYSTNMEITRFFEKHLGETIEFDKTKLLLELTTTLYRATSQFPPAEKNLSAPVRFPPH